MQGTESPTAVWQLPPSRATESPTIYIYIYITAQVPNQLSPLSCTRIRERALVYPHSPHFAHLGLAGEPYFLVLWRPQGHSRSARQADAHRWDRQLGTGSLTSPHCSLDFVVFWLIWELLHHTSPHCSLDSVVLWLVGSCYIPVDLLTRLGSYLPK